MSPEDYGRLLTWMPLVIELTFGMLLIAGNFVRLIILILWLPFNLTLPFMGWTELVGHLPIYGVMALRGKLRAIPKSPKTTASLQPFPG
jgi:hypothetical protein